MNRRRGAAARRRTLLGAALATVLGTVAGRSAVAAGAAADGAQAYPSRPMRIVVGFPPGGPTDRLARELALGLQQAWAHPVIVENKPGAGSRIAFETVARADADGHTLILASVQTATNTAVHRQLSYDVLRDFAPVTQLTSATLVMVVPPALDVRTVHDLVTLARSKPGELTYASFGVASSPHFAGALLEQRAGLRLVHVPYGGAAQAQNALIGGHVQMGFVSALSALPLLQSGQLRALAVMADQRLPQLPAVPTMAEAGFADLEVSSWQGLLAPAATPPAIVARLQREVASWLARPEVRERLLASAAEPVGSTPEAFRALIQAEIIRWTAVARQAGITAD